LATKTTALTLGETAPDAKLLAIGKRIFKAFTANNAALAHFFCFAGTGTAFWEEQVWIDTKAVGLILPTAFKID
jgi:hypothetical protein